jgi:hypothetical protein
MILDAAFDTGDARALRGRRHNTGEGTLTFSERA